MTASCQYDTFCCMSKKRKTKREKLLSDIRNKLQQLEQQQHLVETPRKKIITAASIKESQVIEKQSLSSMRNYSYVILDIKHTIAITLLVILGNILVFSLLSRHIITIPGFL